MSKQTLMKDINYTAKNTKKHEKTRKNTKNILTSRCRWRPRNFEICQHTRGALQRNMGGCVVHVKGLYQICEECRNGTGNAKKHARTANGRHAHVWFQNRCVLTYAVSQQEGPNIQLRFPGILQKESLCRRSCLPASTAMCTCRPRGLRQPIHLEQNQFVALNYLAPNEKIPKRE